MSIAAPRGQAGQGSAPGARVEMLGVVVDPLTMDETVDRIEAMADNGCVHQHVALNAAKVVAAATDAALSATLRKAELASADGMAVVWAGRVLGHHVPERVTGIDLMERLLDRAAARGFPVFFLGAHPETVEAAVAIEQRAHPGLVVAGWHHGYWTAEEEPAVVELVRSSGAKFLFVAMSSPRKEHFLATHREAIGVPFVMGVGGSFDVVSGLVRRAPRWMQHCGFEWMYRLVQEPRRMMRRYLVGNTRFLVMVARELSQQRGLRRRVVR